MTTAAGHRFAVGLTGGIGSGKSTVADLFAERGATIIDTDQIAHALTAPGGPAIAAIVEKFGNEFLRADGAMNRPMMRERVFADSQAKRALETILHPLIGVAVERASQQIRGIYPIYVVPLLVESGRWRARVDRILVVDCPENLQIERVRVRSNLSAEQVLAIMATQVTRSERNAAADDLISNTADLQALTAQVDRLHTHYCLLAAPRE